MLALRACVSRLSIVLYKDEILICSSLLAFLAPLFRLPSLMSFPRGLRLTR